MTRPTFPASRKKSFVDDLFRFSLAVSAIAKKKTNAENGENIYPIYDLSYGPKFPASRKNEFCFRHSSSLSICVHSRNKREKMSTFSILFAGGDFGPITRVISGIEKFCLPGIRRRLLLCKTETKNSPTHFFPGREFGFITRVIGGIEKISFR